MDLRRRLVAALVSLLIAAVIWAYVHGLDRAPARLTVPIRYEIPPDVVLAEGATTEVELRVLATKARLRTLQPSEFDVRVPFRGVMGADRVVIVADDVDAPFAVDVEQVTPSRFSVTYDRKVSKFVPVRPEVTGAPAPGFEVDVEGITSVPPRVRLAGPAQAFVDDRTATTAPVDVTGRDATVGPVRVALLPPDSNFTIEEAGDAMVTVPIRPVQARRTLEEVPIQVVRGEWPTSLPNPRTLRVTVEGPEASVRELSASGVRITLDVSQLRPQADDYRQEPEVVLVDGACPGCRIVALSQQRVNVQVKPPRSSRRQGLRSRAAQGG